MAEPDHQRQLMRALWSSLLVLVLVLAFGLTRHAHAQEDHTPDSYAEWIITQIDQIQSQFSGGDREGGFDAAVALNAEVDQYADFMGDHEVFWYPDLLIARLGVRLERHAEAAAAAAPMVIALDTPQHRGTELRVEGLNLLANALYQMDDYSSAEPVLRSYNALVQEPDVNSRPVWNTEAAYMLAMTVTVTGAGDAAEIRRAVLDGFRDREGASDGLYLRLAFVDLRERRDARARSKPLLQDARKIADFLETSDESDMTTYHSLWGLVARILADHEDFARAVPILQARMGHLALHEPNSDDYFWARQNLAGVLNLQRDYPGALREARAALNSLDSLPDGGDDRYASVRSSIEQVIYIAADGLDETRLSQEALQRAYISLRQIHSANNSEVEIVARRLQKDYIDPATFPYAEELGLHVASQITLSEFGDDVISAVLAGRYARTRNALDNAEKRDDLAPELVALNKAFFHAMLGEIGPGQEALKTVRRILRTSGQTAALPANSFAPDLAEAMLAVYGRNYQPTTANSALARLESRTNLNELTVAIVNMLRATQATNEGDLTRARQIYLPSADDSFALAGLDTWGTVLGVGLLNLALELDDLDRARAFVTDFSARLETASDRALALTAVQVFSLNADPDAMLTERGFQTMAFHIRSLGQMLPEEHQWNIAARVAYAMSLGGRGSWSDGANLMNAALESYRASPWHRRDVAAFLSVSYAWALWNDGQVDLAQNIIAQAYEQVDQGDWQPRYWSDVNFAQAFSRYWQDRQDEALAVLDKALNDTGMMAIVQPVDAVRLYSLKSEVLSRQGNTDEALATLDTAIQILPSDGYYGGAPMAEALRKRAVFHYTVDNSANAFADAVASNDLWFDRYERHANAQTQVARDSNQDLQRVIEEARFGWELTQKLKTETP